MGLRVYWELCRKFGIKCSDKWYKEVPEKVRVSGCGRYEIWWDKMVVTPRRLEANRPDLVVIDRVQMLWKLIDFSVPYDHNIEIKEKEKIEKYAPLAYEIRKMEKVKTEVIPLVIGALGAVTDNLSRYLTSLDVPYIQTCMQKSAVIGTSIILKKVLNS